MKKWLALAWLAPSTALGYVDLVPTGVRFAKVLDDDVSMHYSQHVSISVRNDGNEAVRNATSTRTRVGGGPYSGHLYGPDSAGGPLGGPVRPGEIAKYIVRLPLGTLRHCQTVRVHIDIDRRHQSGAASVYSNDRATFTALEAGNWRPCHLAPTLPVPPIVRQ